MEVGYAFYKFSFKHSSPGYGWLQYCGAYLNETAKSRGKLLTHFVQIIPTTEMLNYEGKKLTFKFENLLTRLFSTLFWFTLIMASIHAFAFQIKEVNSRPLTSFVFLGSQINCSLLLRLFFYYGMKYSSEFLFE